MKMMVLVGIAALGLVGCSKSAGDTPPPSSTGAGVPASATAASAVTATTTAAARPGSPTCALAQEIATSWCERRLQGCKESSMTSEQCKDAFLKHTAVGACKGTDTDKKACLAAVAGLPCESFKVIGSSVPGACTTALQ